MKTKKSNSLMINLRALSLIYKKYPQYIISTFLSSIVTSLAPYIGIYLSSLIIEELASSKDVNRLILLVSITLISIALTSLLSALLKRWKDTQESHLYYKFEKIYIEKLFDMDFENLDDSKTHELLSTIKQNQNGGGWGLFRVCDNFERLISSCFTILGGLSLTITLFISKVPENSGDFVILNHPLFVLLVIILMVGITLLSPYFYYKGEKYFAKYSNRHNLANRLFGFFGWLGYNKELSTDIRMYRQDKICDKYNRNKEDTFSSNGFFSKLAKGPIGIYSSLSAIISIFFIGLVYLFVCLKSYAGAFGIGLVTQYIASITKVSSGLTELVSTSGDMKINSSFLELMFKFLDIENTMSQGSLPLDKDNAIEGKIEFRNVSFKYPNSNDYVLKNINLEINVGKKIALVGMNGSGKTTLIKLLCRLYDPTEGEILLNGINIKEYNYLDYLMYFSVVFQDYKLLSLKLGDNVSSGTKYNKEDVISCVSKAGFKDSLDKMKEGIDTYLFKDINEDGVKVSGGEAQKIAIARALYKDSPFIILDEPTASLDPISEAEIYSRFNQLTGEKTSFYISHRLTSCIFCDEVVVLDKGEIVEHDTHKNLLLNKNGKYYELWNAQAQYYK